MRIAECGQGKVRRNLSGEMACESFIPADLQDVVPISLSESTTYQLANCSRRIGELEGMLRFLPNSGMYLAMYVRKEALLSAQIEGTQCTFDDIMNPERTDLLRKDVVDVINYIKASEYAKERMGALPLCGRLLKETHGILLSGVRGLEKQPGEMRKSQNWIGPTGCTLREAAFIPPNIEDMNAAMARLESFMNDSPPSLDPIVKAALIHYQFETIHPFLDGNGRLGRLLITLSLMGDGVLSDASFYPSYQLKLHRSEYYKRLMKVRTEGDYEGWIGFFCDCMAASAEDAVDSLKALVELHDRSNASIVENMGRSAMNGQRLLELLEGHPIVDIAFIAQELAVSRTTAANLVRAFTDSGILVPFDRDKQRYKLFLYENYLQILRKGDAPLR